MTEPLIVYVFVRTLVAIAILMIILDIALLKILGLSRKSDKEIEKNNVVEFVGEDSEGNGLYRIK